MIKNFIVKKGDQLSFSITFTSNLPISNIEWGIKKEYTDEVYTILKSLYSVNKNIIFIGDSYAEGYTPDGSVTGWPQRVVDKLNLTNYHFRFKGGTGFSNTLSAGTFAELLNSLPSDNSVTDIIVCGGYNDRYATSDNILNGMTEFKNVANTKYPNATISVGMCGWSSIEEQQNSLLRTIDTYVLGCKNNGLNYLNNVTDSLHGHNNYFSSDGVHPNNLGQTVIANNVSDNIKVYDTNGIVKLTDNKYNFTLSSEDTNKLDYLNYPYDIRVIVGNNAKTPLSGKIFIKETVFKEV